MQTAFDILIISAEQSFPDEAGIVNELFSKGLSLFHLRKPGWGFEQTQHLIREIRVEFHSQIVLHNHFELTNTFALKGIHLNEANKKLIPQLQQYHIISASFHSLSGLKQNTFPYQYVLLSPIFNSISKPGHKRQFDLPSLEKELQGTSLQTKVIALGGINAGNIVSVKKTGFAGAALLGAIWESENPVHAFLQIKSETGLK